MPPRTRRRLALVLGLPLPLALLSLGCVSASAAPPSLSPSLCAPDARLAGTWTSARASQLGPATMRFSFGCDCNYESRARVFLMMSIREKGSYRVSDGRLSFSRASGQITTWPIRFEGDRLVLEESSDGLHVYQRTRRTQCANVAPSS